MHSIQHRPFQNHLLAALPAPDFKRLEANLELMRLRSGQVLHEPGCELDCVHFPTTAIVSKVFVMEASAPTVIAIIGNEGILGISLCLGGKTEACRYVVLSAGWCYRLRADFIQTELARAGPLMGLVLGYNQALLIQITRTAICNSYHRTEQQLCCWLLQTLDRLESNSLTMTQEMLASMLRLRREGVVDAVAGLQRAGCIRYARGRITVLDRPELEKRVCGCYAVVRQAYQRLRIPCPASNAAIG
jgi:CRP-like cAMP-binding protein